MVGYVAVFGMLGVLARYGVDSLISRYTELPLATFGVNMVGCLLAGAIVSSKLPPETRLYLLVGFCGGFTTFSAYAVQTLGMVERGSLSPAILYLVLSPVAGLACAWLGSLAIRN